MLASILVLEDDEDHQFLLVDLLETDEKLLERYVGKPGAKTFFEYHREPRHQMRTGVKRATDDHD